MLNRLCSQKQYLEQDELDKWYRFEKEKLGFFYLNETEYRRIFNNWLYSICSKKYIDSAKNNMYRGFCSKQKANKDYCILCSEWKKCVGTEEQRVMCLVCEQIEWYYQLQA